MDKKFNEIEISNFRGFDSIKIDRLSGLNVFVGANNVGKSTTVSYTHLTLPTTERV